MAKIIGATSINEDNSSLKSIDGNYLRNGDLALVLSDDGVFFYKLYGFYFGHYIAYTQCRFLKVNKRLKISKLSWNFIALCYNWIMILVNQFSIKNRRKKC